MQERYDALNGHRSDCQEFACSFTTFELRTVCSNPLCVQTERLKELAFVLNASQLDIVKRWDSGKGELTKQFSAGEVKHLIRALFRNTDRRANTLAKIT